MNINMNVNMNVNIIVNMYDRVYKNFLCWAGINSQGNAGLCVSFFLSLALSRSLWLSHSFFSFLFRRSQG